MRCAVENLSVFHFLNKLTSVYKNTYEAPDIFRILSLSLTQEKLYAFFMQITLAHIGARAGTRSGGKDDLDAATLLYIGRTASYARCQAEAFRSEQALLDWLGKQQGRTPAHAVLLDSRGKQMTSESFATWMGERRDQGTQHVVFAIGPADGWSEEARKRAQLLLSLGQMTMAHTLARVVLAEQIYRAFTILHGHPYHGGH